MALDQLSRTTLADVLRAVDAAEFDKKKRENMASAVRTFAKAMRKSPEEIPADLRTLSGALERISPKAIGLAPGTWNNVKSHVRGSVRLLSATLPGRSTNPISDDWKDLHSAIKNRKDHIRLGRLLRWLSAESISPYGVNAAVLNRFQHAVVEQSLRIDPLSAWLDCARAWNRCVKQVDGWPQIPIVIESRANTFSFPWSYFPPSLEQDVDKWLARLSHSDFADEEGPPRPLAAPSLAAWEYRLRSFASALVRQGRDPASLTTLAACVTIENYKE